MTSQPLLSWSASTWSNIRVVARNRADTVEGCEKRRLGRQRFWICVKHAECTARSEKGRGKSSERLLHADTTTGLTYYAESTYRIVQLDCTSSNIIVGTISSQNLPVATSKYNKEQTLTANLKPPTNLQFSNTWAMRVFFRP